MEILEIEKTKFISHENGMLNTSEYMTITGLGFIDIRDQKFPVLTTTRDFIPMHAMQRDKEGTFSKEFTNIEREKSILKAIGFALNKRVRVYSDGRIDLCLL